MGSQIDTAKSGITRYDVRWI